MTAPFTIALAGKGGTGKTSLTGLLVKTLREKGKGPILAVDADPNSSLPEILGVSVNQTIGDLREDTLDNISELPPSLSKSSYLELGVEECLIENQGFDMLVMGHGEGPKCYCMVNHILRKYIEMLRKNYHYVIIDNEAGMEHLSRRTTQNVDILFIVSQPEPVSIRSAARISQLVKKLKLRVKEQFLILNKVRRDLSSNLEDEIANTGLSLLGEIPEDEELSQLAVEGKPIWKLSSHSPAQVAVECFLKKLGENFSQLHHSFRRNSSG